MLPEIPHMKRFFLSCCQQDLDIAHQVKAEIEKWGYSVLLESTKFSTSQHTWPTEIDQGIREAVGLLVIVTPEAINCEFVSYEWAFALGAQRPVLPLIFSPTTLPRRLRPLFSLDCTSTPPWETIADVLQDMSNESSPVLTTSGSGKTIKARRRGGAGNLDPARADIGFEPADPSGQMSVRHVLMNSLQHPMREVRIQAALMLAQFKEVQAVPVLIDALHDLESDTAQHAVWGLMNIGSPAVPDLIAALQDSNSQVRRDIARILGKIGATTAVPALIDTLQDPIAVVRRAAIESLGYIGSVVAVPPLLTMLRDAEEQVRRAAAEALGHIGDASAVLDLINALHDERENVRIVAAWALGQIRDAAAVPALIDALREKSPQVRQAAAEMLKEIGTLADEEALSVLLQDEDIEVRRTAARVLAHIRSRYRSSGWH